MKIKNIKNPILQIYRAKNGAVAVEYALLLSLVFLAFLAASRNVGNAASNNMNTVSTAISTAR